MDKHSNFCCRSQKWKHTSVMVTKSFHCLQFLTLWGAVGLHTLYTDANYGQIQFENIHEHLDGRTQTTIDRWYPSLIKAELEYYKTYHNCLNVKGNVSSLTQCVEKSQGTVYVDPNVLCLTPNMSDMTKMSAVGHVHYCILILTLCPPLASPAGSRSSFVGNDMLEVAIWHWTTIYTSCIPCDRGIKDTKKPLFIKNRHILSLQSRWHWQKIV